MAPRPLSRRHGRRRRPADWRFMGMVAAVAGAAFWAALAWPSRDPSPLADVSSAAVGPPRSAAPPRTDLTCAVASVTDGDTLRCADGVRIRLHAVAAREADGSCNAGHPCPSASAAAATQALRRLVAGRTITCRTTGRSYNRLTAICWTPSGEEVNCAMIRSGTTLLWARFDREVPLCRSGVRSG